MALGITRAAFGVSSDSVVTASKPRKEKQTIVAPVIIGIRCAFSLINGWSDQTVPTPSPLCRPCTTSMTNTTMMAICTSTNRVLKLATRFTLFRFASVRIVTNPTTQTHGGTSGNSAER